MSALHGLGITNLLVKTDDEVPALDGSAAEFCRQLSEAGIQEQGAFVEPIAVKQPITIGGDGEYIRIEPAKRLIIDYTLEYPRPIGVQQVHFEMTSPAAYANEIAPARTFGFVREFRKLAEMGLASGGAPAKFILRRQHESVETGIAL